MALRRLVFHPFLIGLYPVLRIFSGHIEETPPHLLVRPLCVLLGITVFLWILGWWLSRDMRKGALLASCALGVNLFFSELLVGFERTARTFAVILPGRDLPARQLFFLSALIVLWGALTVLIIRMRRGTAYLTIFLNLVSFVWIAFPCYAIVTRWPVASATLTPIDMAVSTPISVKKPPHIIHIVLDAYGRADTLHRLYGYDNGPFLQALTDRGFYVATQSRSNYAQTALSLASMLNLTYLDELAEAQGPSSFNRRPLTTLIDRNQVATFLRQHGYTFVTFSSGVCWTSLQEPDQTLSKPYFLNEVEQVLLQETTFPVLVRLMWLLPGGKAIPDLHDLHRARILYILDALPTLAASEQPLYVLAHVMAPHPPFVFRQGGERPRIDEPFSYTEGVDPTQIARYVAGYREQVAFLNKKILATIDGMFEQAANDPIVIIHGDHGPGSRVLSGDPNDERSFARTDLEERMGILNAYYFPDRDYHRLYEAVTPVNTFRVIFNQYFGTALPLLEDSSYASTWKYPYRFYDVTHQALPSQE